ncbi:hypothetical protein [Arthrospiribacter ruber]|uniref:Uncharacterized protein n=1 Tax=Arthrospiribacter ruber TaxID=2487934 RepID=A0A951J1I5_9BACT|nr:hypothetical protein [Arthrospiribacter ruber]MBW3470149.1 hypothetical protein [Arthrospiribacter ruber]MBW3470535.1 hypothetical protein [Arthrospiribacter ruber]
MRRRSRHSGQALLSRAPRRTSTIGAAGPVRLGGAYPPRRSGTGRGGPKTILIRASNPSPGTVNPNTHSSPLCTSYFVHGTWYYYS